MAGKASWARQLGFALEEVKNSLEQHLGVAWGRVGMEVPGLIRCLGQGWGSALSMFEEEDAASWV